MIGDGINDIYVAKNAGISSVAYLNGLGSKDDLLSAKADYYCESLLELNCLFIRLIKLKNYFAFLNSLSI